MLCAHVIEPGLTQNPILKERERNQCCGDDVEQTHNVIKIRSRDQSFAFLHRRELHCNSTNMPFD